MRRRLRKAMSVRRSPRKCILFLVLVKLDWTFVSVMHNGGDIMEAVGDTDAMLDGPSMGWLPGLLSLDEDGSTWAWIWPRNELRRRNTLLIELPLPWLQ